MNNLSRLKTPSSEAQSCFVQGAGLSSSVPSSYSEALTAYLSRCAQQSGDGPKREYTFVLLSLLRDFISHLRCHDTSFKGKNSPEGKTAVGSPDDIITSAVLLPGEVWWNPEKLDTNTCCYLSLTCRLFSVLISGAGEGPAASSFREFMKLLIQV